MDVEEELRRVLLAQPEPSTPDDVVPAVHAGMRRRVRRKRLSYLGAAAGVLALWGGAVAVLQPVTSTKPKVPITMITNVPGGFQIRDLTFVSTTRGYGLGTVPCGAGHCTVLLQTDTGTQAWERAPGPLVPNVSQIRFATDARGEEIGYAYGPSYLVFRDGDWTRQATGRRVEALEAAKAGTVVRVLAREGGGHYVQQSTLGGTDWKTVHTILAPTFNAALRRQGPRLVLVTYDNNTITTEPNVSDVRFSTDGGSTWKKGSHNPCDTESAFRSIALASRQRVVVVCARRTGNSYVRMSEDNGTHFGPVRELPAGVDATQVAAPAGGGWLVAGDVADEHARVVVASHDDGSTWKRVATEKAPAGAAAAGYLDNSNATTVWWIGADPRYVWRTDDGGDTWTAGLFR